MKLSGIIYLHRTTDTRMGGSARKILSMFRKLCGTEVLQNVLLVSTMWETTELSTGERREKELVDTEDFWGLLLGGGAKVERHDNSRESAMRLLKNLVGKNRVTMSIQKEMVNEHKTLDQTLDQTLEGLKIVAELQKERDKVEKGLAEVQQMMKEAMQPQDQTVESLRQREVDMQEKIDLVIKGREQLKVSMEKMDSEIFANLDEKCKKKQAELLENLERFRKREAKMPLTHRIIYALGFDKKYRKQQAEFLETMESLAKLEHLQRLEPEAKNTATRQIPLDCRIESTLAFDSIGWPVSLSISGTDHLFVGPDYNSW
jgi:hypothetical protein